MRSAGKKYHERGNRPPREAVVEGVPVSQVDITEPAAPLASFSLLEIEGHADFVLPALAEAMLVVNAALQRSRVARHRIDRENGLALGKGLLGEEGSREIEIAPRPAWFGAERVQILDDPLDLVIGQDVIERRHDMALAPRPSAAVNHSQPNEVGFDRSDGAIREVREAIRRLEAENRLGLASAIRSVTGRARRLIHLFAGPLGLRLTACGLGLGRRRAADKRNQQCSEKDLLTIHSVFRGVVLCPKECCGKMLQER